MVKWREPRIHKTPALVSADGCGSLHFRVRRWRRLFLRLLSTQSKALAGMGGETELFGQSECRSSRTTLRDPRTVGVGLHPTGSIGQNAEVRSAQHQGAYGVCITSLDRFPLLSSKRVDLERFGSVCAAIAEGRHRTRAGFAAIVTDGMRMNSSGRRKYSEDEILSSLRSDEGIVYAHGKTVGKT